MRNRLAHLPTDALECEARRLEHRIIDGCAHEADIDAFVTLQSELGRRIALDVREERVLDGILDPRD